MVRPSLLPAATASSLFPVSNPKTPTTTTHWDKYHKGLFPWVLARVQSCAFGLSLWVFLSSFFCICPPVMHCFGHLSNWRYRRGFSQSFSHIWGLKITSRELCTYCSWSTAVPLSKPWVAWCSNLAKGTIWAGPAITNPYLAQTSYIGHEFL